MVDPGIAEIVQYVRLFGIELERVYEVFFRAAPLLRPFQRDAPRIDESL